MKDNGTRAATKPRAKRVKDPSIPADLKVGDVVGVAGPDHRGHGDRWDKMVVVSATRVAWYVGPSWCMRQTPSRRHLIAVPKHCRPPHIAFTDRQMQEYDWARDNQHVVVRAVSTVRDFATLDAIARIVGVPTLPPVPSQNATTTEAAR